MNFDAHLLTLTLYFPLSCCAFYVFLLVSLCVLGIFAVAVTSDDLNILPTKHTDEIVSSAECSSDDEDLEECETSHAGGLG